MKVLWIVNSMMNEIAKEAGRKAGFGGGWIPSMAERLKEIPDIHLSIVVFGTCKQCKIIKKDNICYYIFPQIKNLKKNGGGEKAAQIWDYIINKAQPDIVHIYGTEQPTSIEFVRRNRSVPTIVSLQGILSEYYRHYYGNMEMTDLLKYNMPIDLVLGSSGIFGRKKFKRNIPYEKEILKTVKYVEGRTIWDRSVSKSLNHNLIYYKCNRMLRPEFYKSSKWIYEKAEKYSIFIHQGNYSIKGLHVLIQAIAYLKKKYPNVKVYIAGQDPTNKKGIKGKLSVNGYSKYIKKLAKKLKVLDNICYVGSLNAREVANMLTKSNVMVVPSAIENSPNSLAEAMLLGVPCVASYVGGNAEMMEYGKSGLLYSYNDPIMLATNIDSIFSNQKTSYIFSENAKKTAEERHNPEKLINNLIWIYDDIVEREKL